MFQKTAFSLPEYTLIIFLSPRKCFLIFFRDLAARVQTDPMCEWKELVHAAISISYQRPM